MPRCDTIINDPEVNYDQKIDKANARLSRGSPQSTEDVTSVKIS